MLESGPLIGGLERGERVAGLLQMGQGPDVDSGVKKEQGNFVIWLLGLERNVLWRERDLRLPFTSALPSEQKRDHVFAWKTLGIHGIGWSFFSYSNINHEISSKPFKLSVPQFVSLVTKGFKMSTM